MSHLSIFVLADVEFSQAALRAGAKCNSILGFDLWVLILDTFHHMASARGD